MSDQLDLYQQVILEHNRKPRNFKKLESASHQAEGFNPLCGDHLWVYLRLNQEGNIDEVCFEGSGCAISKASASMMTVALKGKSEDQAKTLFSLFHQLICGELSLEAASSIPGSLKIFSSISRYPSRIKCASLAWHAMNAAFSSANATSASVSTENEEGNTP